MPTLGRQQSSEYVEKGKARPWWIDSCFVMAGLACDSYLAFKWFSVKYAFFSVTVLRAVAFVAVLCALVSMLAARILGGRGKLRDSGAVFFLVSLTLLGNLLMWWTTQR